MSIWYWFPSLNRPLWMKHCCTLTFSLVGMCSGLWTVIWNFPTRWLQLCKPPATRLSHSGSGLSRSSNCCSSSFPPDCTRRAWDCRQRWEGGGAASPVGTYLGISAVCAANILLDVEGGERWANWVQMKLQCANPQNDRYAKVTCL